MIGFFVGLGIGLACTVATYIKYVDVKAFIASHVAKLESLVTTEEAKIKNDLIDIIDKVKSKL